MEREQGTSAEPQLATGRIRRAARTLMVEAAMAQTTAGFGTSSQEIARLEQGIDPDVIDYSSEDYRMGAVEALSATQNAAAEMLIHPDVAQRLLTPDVGRTFIGLLGNRTPLGEFCSGLDIEENELLKAIDFLHRTGLAEYGAMDQDIDHTWYVSPFGEQTFMRLLPELARQVPLKELTRAFERFIKTKSPQ